MANVIVKIKRDSIRKNPNAGRMHTTISRGIDIEFRLKGFRKLPDFLEEDKHAFITSQSFSTNPFDYEDNWIKGHLIDASKLEELQKTKGAEVTLHHNTETFRHMPEPYYFYEYENPQVECKHCHSSVHVKDIINDWEFDGEDEYEYIECPICGYRDTFPEIKYETITEALREAE